MAMFHGKQDPARSEFETEAVAHLDALYANALRLTRSPVDAEDLVQETFVKACRFYDSFERGTNLRAWLFRIQYNTFVNHYRRSLKAAEAAETLKKEPAGRQVVGRAALDALADAEGTALRPLVAEEIEAALDSLPEEHRVVVVLADVEEFSYREIAEVVGCPIGTVMSRLHRARRALRARLVDQARQLGLVDEGADPGIEQETDSDTAEPVSLEAYRRDRSSS